MKFMDQFLGRLTSLEMVKCRAISSVCCFTLSCRNFPEQHVHRTLTNAHTCTHTHTYIYIYTHTHTYIYIYIRSLSICPSIYISWAKTKTATAEASGIVSTAILRVAAGVGDGSHSWQPRNRHPRYRNRHPRYRTHQKSWGVLNLGCYGIAMWFFTQNPIRLYPKFRPRTHTSSIISYNFH